MAYAGSFAFIIVVLLCIFVVVKFFKYENGQNQKISALENQMRILKEGMASNEFVKNCRGRPSEN